ncbi:hypothetical protein OQ601_06260 [Acinetobacter baumannii]|uniref:hypothetical protein n=1 Tax=Acinetobacter calcoaceticus/baumannii complex TaxID=909768 RepID=UPI00094CF874|nr:MULTISPECIES: hypothetical protein [Acinetobacter calcoaceticus/baumannii complex]MCW1509387.1 hypothetical protein [Acinetobacter baumannii]MCX2426762.1 hypothetical protein [Acinetobacter baumannii]MDB0078851.1 hypothetical protein [Acinetobacter baumannii]PNH14272.1 hypothetical protein DSM30011_012825 [Acinetobacter baumannii]UMO41695.1 hypothetical protein L2Z44_10695 [Acinetobacter baumannii]
MTAEIAILNPHGVALAADSAVTIGSQKIINSAIKLFSLSKTEPVGVMVYGNANLLNIPWETLIKIYRKEHAKNRFEKLENYAESFLSFLKARVTIFDLNIQDQWLEKQIIFIFDFIKNQLQNDVTQKIVRGESVTADDEEKFIIEILTKIRDFHSGYEPTWSGDISPAKSKIELVSEPIIKHYFQEFLKNSDVISLLNEIVILTVTNNGFIEASTGLVISGFGDDDIFPSVITYQISGYFENTLIYKKDEEKTIVNTNSGMRSGIIAFAQEDVVQSFIRGFDPELHQFTIEYLDSMLTEFLKKTPNLNPVEISQLINKSKTMLNDFNTTLQQEIRDRHLTPMIDMIGVLPKDELATMAETLVNITAFKRKMAYSSLETVGGPIDVAVISKGDGLVWVKRKQYFPSNLNQHFFDNYFKD